MKKTLVVIALASSMLLAGGAALAADAVYKMNLTSQYMDKHPVVQKVYLPWAEAIKNKTGGRVEITYFNPGTICPEGEIFDSVKKGQVSIGSHYATRNPGKLATLGVFGIPTAVSTATQASTVAWRYLQTTPEVQDEFKGVKILTIHSSAPAHFAFVKSSYAKTMSDLNGKKLLGASGSSARIIRALGGNPITLPFADYYLSLQRGMADGCLTPIAPMRSFKINEATNSMSIVGLAFASLWFGMNEDLWNSLPPDIQAVFEEMSGENMSRQAGNILDATDKAELEAMRKGGMKIYVLPTEERAKWIAATGAAVKESWLETMKGSSADPDKIFKHYLKISEEVAEEIKP